MQTTTKKRQGEERDNNKKEDKTRQERLMDKQVQAAVNKELEKEDGTKTRTMPDVLSSLWYDGKKAQRMLPILLLNPYSRIYYNPSCAVTNQFIILLLSRIRYIRLLFRRYAHRHHGRCQNRPDRLQGWTTGEVKQQNVTQKENTG